MITNIQMQAMTEDELSYLYYALNKEWDSLNMGYEFNINIMKAFRADAIQYILNKYSGELKEENKKIIMDILLKLQNNI